MRRVFSVLLVLVAGVLSFASGQESTSTSPVRNGGDFSTAGESGAPIVKVPEGVILVKGAWSSASDSVTPLPEGGVVSGSAYQNDYFKLKYPLPQGWGRQYEGPPPSDTGRYVLAQIRPEERNGQIKGSILVTAQDLFFTPLPAADSMQTLVFVKDNLQADYKLEQPPTQTKIAGRSFGFMAYWSPVAQLHWYLVETQIRCHTVEVVMSSRDPKLMESLLLGLDKMTLPAEAGLAEGKGGSDFPVCVKDYATGKNVLSKVEPVLSETKYNPVPVRIIIDKQGRVKHIHFLSAFESQTKAISDALGQWRFKPYVVGGQPVEVETGIMFGRTGTVANQQGRAPAVE
jgi:hypothetical protein